MIYALGNAALILIALALFGLVSDPVSLFSFMDASQAPWAFLFLLIGLFAVAEVLNGQRFETPGRMFTTWITGGLAIVVIGLNFLNVLQTTAIARPQPVSKAEVEPAQTVKLQSRAEEEDTSQASTYGSVELRAASNGSFYTKATINDAKVNALIDTGASFVALTYKDAEAMALDPLNLDYNIKLRTANGISYGAEVVLDEVTVAGITVNNVKAVVSRPGALGITLLGMTFLSRAGGFKVAGNKLTLGE